MSAAVGRAVFFTSARTGAPGKPRATPEEAISAFRQSCLDWLLLGPFMVRVKPSEAQPA